ncbi:MAG TPA: hypothetical protein VF491_17525 [Vicinamibacterales bacterium]
MTRRPIRLVAPFLPLAPQNTHHQALADFDWIDAIRMLSHSAELACGRPVQVITDAAADMPLPCLRYSTVHRRLMLWVLEACVRYLESPEFDRDTVCLDCDQLVGQDLSRFFAPRVDLGLLVRPDLQHRDTWKKVINGVQFWAVGAKACLVAFYRAALARAEQLPEHLLLWGADTEAIRQLIEPVSVGLHERCGLRVHLIDEARVSRALTQDQIDGMHRGVAPQFTHAVMDFRYRRKCYMRHVYEMSVLSQVPACA